MRDLTELGVSTEATETPAGRLLSVNVGGPRDVEWEGKTVRTAIWKAPVTGPRTVRRINIDGDDQADRNAHGGEHRAVFVYQIESYRHWERELLRDDFTYGQFGENFTVDGMSDQDVCIGDRYRIGDAIFEVTQPRVTCFRVGIRLNDPRMPSLLVSHHRPGFYLRVLQEGRVQAGDSIVRVQVGPERLSVADADALLYLPHKSRRALQRALRIPALSDGWRGSFEALLEHDGKAKPGEHAAWPGFVPLTVVDIHRESDAIVSLTLAPADGRPANAIRAGQYLTFRLRPDGPDAAAVVRSYSLSAVVAQERYRISVKREPGGLGSAYLQQRVRVGDTIEAAAPRGEFTLREGRRPVALISAGVGATPVLAMLQALAGSGDDREVWWLHSARNRASHAFGTEVDGLLRRLSRAHRVVTYSRPRPGEAPGLDFDAVGRISIETITEAGVPADADYYICGPAEFMSSLAAALVAGGVAPERVAMETFGAVAAGARPPGMDGVQPPPHPPGGEAGSGPAVTFSRSGLTVAWDPSYGNLLELAEACDVPVTFGCRNGVCHYCESGLLTGDVDYVTEPLEAPDSEHVLMCCAQPTSEVTLEL
jgi:ferredoxin-NADP reductase/MOSC domain-containing protein YiiM